ncbi:MAG TPA: hypothetical protein VJI13_00315 [Candidatus Norongarragalinales archaeon]|nr:hypothetical protein [Candidatus Norongarragalinales archaeon]
MPETEDHAAARTLIQSIRQIFPGPHFELVDANMPEKGFHVFPIALTEPDIHDLRTELGRVGLLNQILISAQIPRPGVDKRFTIKPKPDAHPTDRIIGILKVVKGHFDL